jgi:citrate lyase subunit beta/citryl-CoA lyase
MHDVELPPLTWLYVPADRPERVVKAIASRAHAVIVDLEDAVSPGAKEPARAGLDGLLATPFAKVVHVRVNRVSTPWGQDDVAVVKGLGGVVGLHLPKVETPDDVDDALALVGDAPLRVHCLIESALGVENAFAIASAPGVTSISLGEADLRAETGATEEGLDWARARVVNAAVAAGLPRPPQSVYTHVRDTEGLARSCVRGRALGHLGRAAIHPDQLEVIEQAYLPDGAEVARARELLAAGEGGAAALDDGRFVDEAVLRGARVVVALAERYGERRTARPADG